MISETRNTDLARRVCHFKASERARQLSIRYTHARQSHNASEAIHRKLVDVRNRLIYLEGGGDPFVRG